VGLVSVPGTATPIQPAERSALNSRWLGPDIPRVWSIAGGLLQVDPSPSGEYSLAE
jgi:hypothetical protein